MDLLAWATETANLFTAAGVPTAIDKRDVTVPGALLAPRTITPDRLAEGIYTVEWDLVLIAGGSGTATALDELGAMGTVLETAGLLDVPLEAVIFDLPNHNPDGLPALTGTYTNECED